MIKQSIFRVFCAGLLASLAPLVHSSQLIGIEFTVAPTSLYDIDASTGAATTLAPIPFFGSGLAYDPGRRIYYASDPALDILYAIDPVTYGATRLVGGFNFGALAYDAFTDTLYAAANDSPRGVFEILAVDAATLDIRNLGNPSIGFINALGFDTDERALYGIGVGDDFVRFDDLSNLNAKTRISELRSQGFGLVAALTYDPDGERFLASATNQPFRSLLSIDPRSGTAEPIGPHGQGNVSFRGLAMVVSESRSPVFEPPSHLLVILGLLGLGHARRCRRRARARTNLAH
ncbi:MAG: hypothetical protein H6983_02475 [Ectothiorhodospiraceae bacterium]|nr:hypothetical protein [Ectothiorhodospiraceae bacterium]